MRNAQEAIHAWWLCKHTDTGGKTARVRKKLKTSKRVRQHTTHIKYPICYTPSLSRIFLRCAPQHLPHLPHTQHIEHIECIVDAWHDCSHTVVYFICVPCWTLAPTGEPTHYPPGTTSGPESCVGAVAVVVVVALLRVAQRNVFMRLVRLLKCTQTNPQHTRILH